MLDPISTQLLPAVVAILVTLFGGPPTAPRTFTGRSGAASAGLDLQVVSGPLATNVVRRFLRRRLAEVAFCVERDRIADPHFGPRAHLQAFFTIDSKGAVAHANVTGVDDGVSQCVVHVIEAIEFPKPTTASDVTVAASFPVTFESSQEIR